MMRCFQRTAGWCKAESSPFPVSPPSSAPNRPGICSGSSRLRRFTPDTASRVPVFISRNKSGTAEVIYAFVS